MSAKPQGPVRRLLDYPALAVYLGVSKRQAEKLAKAGEFPKVTIGARVLFDVVDVDAYIERLKAAS